MTRPTISIGRLQATVDAAKGVSNLPRADAAFVRDLTAVLDHVARAETALRKTRAFLGWFDEPPTLIDAEWGKAWVIPETVGSERTQDSIDALKAEIASVV